MTTAREDILTKIRRGRGDERGTVVDARLRDHAPNLVPKRGQVDRPARLDLFCEEAQKVEASVARVAGRAAVPGEVARYLKAANLGTRIRVAPVLEELDWQGTLLEVDSGAAEKTDQVSVTDAFACVAETGTVVTLSGRRRPTTLNFLPATNIVIVDAATVVGSYEGVWRRLRGSTGEDGPFMPRTVNFITGPSRSADIEQTLLLGAHGPQRLHIVVVDDENPQTA